MTDTHVLAYLSLPGIHRRPSALSTTLPFLWFTFLYSLNLNLPRPTPRDILNTQPRTYNRRRTVQPPTTTRALDPPLPLASPIPGPRALLYRTPVASFRDVSRRIALSEFLATSSPASIKVVHLPPELSDASNCTFKQAVIP